MVVHQTASAQDTSGSVREGAAGKVTIVVEASDIGNVAVNRGDADAGSAPASAVVTNPATPQGALQTLRDSVRGMLAGFLRQLPNLGIALVVLLLTAVGAKLVARGGSRLFAGLRIKASLRDLFTQLLRVAVWLIGLLLAAGILFPGFGFTQIIATAGLASIAIGFAFKDIFENFFAGILILWNYPFAAGDYIEVTESDINGCIEDIWIRVTLIRQTDGQLVVVPNSTIYANAVRVLTNRPLRRASLICGVGYGEDVGASRTVIRTAVEQCPSVSRDRAVDVFAMEFADSSINFEVRWWTGAKPVEQRRSRDEVVESIKKALDEAGIEIPFPYHTITFKSSDPLTLARAGAGVRPGGSAADHERHQDLEN
ncbi:MAG: mechanosensitive ion channel family protein [Chthoniobacteraceae bacterium]